MVKYLITGIRKVSESSCRKFKSFVILGMSYSTSYPSVPRQFGFSTGSLLPARLDAKQTAHVLGFQEHDIPVLVGRNLLEPLGKPAENARKYFARLEIMEKADDVTWLGKATKALSEHWQEKNANRKTNGDESSHPE